MVGLAKEIERLGHQTEIVSAFGQDLLTEDRLALAERDGRLLWGKLSRIGHILATLAQKARTADVIHINLPTPAFAMLGDLLQTFVSVPVVVGFEAHLAETRSISRFDGIREAPAFYLPRLLVNNGLVARCTAHRCPLYIVSSRHQASELGRLGFPSSRVRVIPNVVDRAKLRPLAQQEARDRLKLPTGPLVAYVGHYHHVKGVETLLEGMSRLARDHSDSRVVLAWSGIGDPRPIERAIATLGLSDRVIRLGRTPINALLSAVDVLALPYRLTMGQNAFPGLVLEALEVGVPLVTTDLPLLREILEPGRTALLVPPGDASGIATAIGELLANRSLAAAMIVEQRRLMDGALNPWNLAKRYVDVYRETAREAAGVGSLAHSAGGD